MLNPSTVHNANVRHALLLRFRGAHDWRRDFPNRNSFLYFLLCNFGRWKSSPSLYWRTHSGKADVRVEIAFEYTLLSHFKQLRACERGNCIRVYSSIKFQITIPVCERWDWIRVYSSITFQNTPRVREVRLNSSILFYHISKHSSWVRGEIAFEHTLLSSDISNYNPCGWDCIRVYPSTTFRNIPCVWEGRLRSSIFFYRISNYNPRAWEGRLQPHFETFLHSSISLYARGEIVNWVRVYYTQIQSPISHTGIVILNLVEEYTRMQSPLSHTRSCLKCDRRV